MRGAVLPVEYYLMGIDYAGSDALLPWRFRVFAEKNAYLH
jgi:hypothetical protein